jgi:uncharacterized SAM-binding protein YcdF (DUF218 family)
MTLANAFAAFSVLLGLLYLPAVLMMALGLAYWYRGRKQQNLNRQRSGLLLLVFGGILVAIVAVIQLFMQQVYQV